MFYSSNSAIPMPILLKYHFTIEQVYDETEDYSDYLLSITSPKGFTYRFYAACEDPIDDIVYEALEFEALEYYSFLQNHYGKEPQDLDLIDEAVWTKRQLVELSKDLLAWRMEQNEGC